MKRKFLALSMVACVLLSGCGIRSGMERSDDASRPRSRRRTSSTSSTRSSRRRKGISLREIRRRLTGDPFPKVGIAAMVLTLAFAGVVGIFAFLERPQRAVAPRDPAETSTGEPLYPVHRGSSLSAALARWPE